MTLQVFLQARLAGTDRFLAAATGDIELRLRWISLLSEVLPRALLAELGLAKLLLGTSGGEQFLVVIPLESRPAAEEFLSRAALAIEQASQGQVRLVWGSTENLGDWSDIRKRLTEQLHTKLHAPAPADHSFFAPFTPAAEPEWFSAPLTRAVSTVGWSPETPAVIRVPGGKHTWPLAPASDGIPLVRHEALDDNEQPATPETLASRAVGRPAWGVLRGDVDGFEARLNRAQNVEEHIQLSIMYKQFFAGELEMLCSMPEFFRRITLLSSGGDDFAVYGAWDALIPFAREVQRLFHRFVNANLRDLAGAEGKTISAAIILAAAPEDTLSSVFRAAGQQLEIAKASGKDSLFAFSRALEWKQLQDASDARAVMVRLVQEFGCSPVFLNELSGFYRDAAVETRRRRIDRLERPWRFHRRLNRVINASGAAARNREFQRLRSELIADFTGRNAAQVRLRPAGRVALEWAHLETEHLT
jgi:CRISPR-associated protein Csm1